MKWMLPLAAVALLAAADAPADARARERLSDAQRARLRYRDSFLAFARVKYPKLAADSLAASLTDQRIAMLAAEE